MTCYVRSVASPRLSFCVHHVPQIYVRSGWSFVYVDFTFVTFLLLFVTFRCCCCWWFLICYVQIVNLFIRWAYICYVVRLFDPTFAFDLFGVVVIRYIVGICCCCCYSCNFIHWWFVVDTFSLIDLIRCSVSICSTFRWFRCSIHCPRFRSIRCCVVVVPFTLIAEASFVRWSFVPRFLFTDLLEFVLNCCWFILDSCSWICSWWCSIGSQCCPQWSWILGFYHVLDFHTYSFVPRFVSGISFVPHVYVHVYVWIFRLRWFVTFRSADFTFSTVPSSFTRSRFYVDFRISFRFWTTFTLFVDSIDLIVVVVTFVSLLFVRCSRCSDFTWPTFVLFDHVDCCW